MADDLTLDQDMDKDMDDAQDTEEETPTDVDPDEPSLEDLVAMEEDMALEDGDGDRAKDLLKEDADSIREESSSDPSNLDPGITDDNWEDRELRKGMEDTEDEEDLDALGFHEETLDDVARESSSDDDL